MSLVIEKRMEFEAEIDRVWRALTVGDELAGWFPNGGAFDLGPGAEGRFVWQNHGAHAVRVEIFEPPRRLVWRWAKNPGVELSASPSTLVEFTLSERAGGGTVLELRESGFETAEHLESNTGGWRSELGELSDYLAAD
jgi:uncharacterized protein YndB with AHSA1/START domain